MLVPGFPNGKPCALCITSWIIIIAIVALMIQVVRIKAKETS
jgi:hypothetical protein